MAIAASAVVWQRYSAFTQASALPQPINQLFVPQGQGFAKTVDSLMANGARGERWQWLVLARLQPRLGLVQAGEYEIPANATPAEVLDQLARGRVKRYAFTIIEGATVNELRRSLANDARLAQTLTGLGEAEISKRLENPEPSLEGWFLPETYLFVRGDSDFSVLKRANLAMRGTLAQVWLERSEASPLRDQTELLTLASIVEKETGHGPERDEIAGVFTRRLKLGMKLQTDPTVIYGLGSKFDGNLRRIDLQTPTPYNSYTQTGLPPTPIALPGLASLRASIAPAGGSALYFVARGDGTSEFSSTLDAHNQAVRRFQLKR